MDIVTQRRFLGSAVAPYYGSKWITSSTSSILRQVVLDSQGNSYTIGTLSNSVFISKIDTNGTVVWQRTLSTASASALTVDNLGNVYGTGPINSSSSAGLVFKYDSSGNLIWQRRLSVASVVLYFRTISVDSSGNVYVAGQGSTSGADWVAKYDTSGVLQWVKSILEQNGNGYWSSSTIDSSGNLILGGKWGASGLAALAKLDSSGNVIWRRRVGAATVTSFDGISIDPSGNIVAISLTPGTGAPDAYDCLVLKFDSNASSLWGRRFGSTSFNDQLNAVCVDASSNIYVVGADGTGTGSYTGNPIVTQLSPAGVIQWKRNFNVTGLIGQNNSVRVDENSNMFFTGSSIFTSDTWLAKFPSDGSLTGTYGSFSYSSGTYGVNTTLTPSVDSPTVTSGSTGITDTAGSGVSSTATEVLTKTVVSA